MDQFLTIPTKQSKESLRLTTEEDVLDIPDDDTAFFAGELIPIQVLQSSLKINRSISKEHQKELSYILRQILTLPSLEEAQIHSRANRLGTLDVKGKKTGRTSFCKCCGFAKQQQSIPLCTSFNNFPGAGLSIYLFFQTIKNILFLLIFLMFAFAAYSLVTNCLIAGIFTNGYTFQINQFEEFLILISLASKRLTNSAQSNKFYLIEVWICVGVVVIWSLLLFGIKYLERGYEVMVDSETISASDFSILIQNYPKSLTRQQLQSQLTTYESTLPAGQVTNFHIEKINQNQTFQMDENKKDELDSINIKYQEKLQMFVDSIEYYLENGGFSGLRQKRIEQYKAFQQLKSQRKETGKSLVQNMFKGLKKDDNIFNMFAAEQPQQNKQEEGKSIAIVTFSCSNSKDAIAKYNTMNFADRVRYLLKCCSNKNQLILMDPSTSPPTPFSNIVISKAPEPEDIIWQNLSATECEKFLRKLGTYFVTLCLLGISVGCVYYLTLKQVQNSSNFYLGILISLSISVINFMIGFLINFLTVLEKPYTSTGHQTSLAIKSIAAQVINSIAVPIIANYLIESKNIFRSHGLAVDVIYLSATNSFLPPIIKILNPYYRYLRIRSSYYRHSPAKQFLLKQSELNDTQELMQFQIGYEYIYYINLHLFAAFFITLQPVTVVFSLFGASCMFWVHKFTLLHRSKRPIPGTDLISTAMGQIVNLGPVFFALGTLCWSNILHDESDVIDRNRLLYVLPSYISIGLSLFFLLFPFSILFENCLTKESGENLNFQESRIWMSSEYDRTNPATMGDAIKEYEEYLEAYARLENNTKINVEAAHQKIQMEGLEGMDGHSGFEIVESIENQELEHHEQTHNNDFLVRKKQHLRDQATRKSGVAGLIGEFGLNKQLLKGLVNLTSNLPELPISPPAKIDKIEVKARTTKQKQRENIITVFPNKIQQNLEIKKPQRQAPRNLDYMKYFGTSTNMVSNDYYDSQHHNRRRNRRRNNPYELSFG